MTESRSDILRSRVLRVAAIRALEAAGQARRPSDSQMDRAGRAVASLAVAMASERVGPVVVLTGPGNNGGDALVAARELCRKGIDVRVALLDPGTPYQGDALLAWTRWQETAGGKATVDVPIRLIDVVADRRRALRHRLQGRYRP